MSNNPNSQSVPNLLRECAGNPSGVNGGTGVSTTNGSVGNALQALEDCFLGGYDNNTARIMHVTLPVIDCEGSIGTTNCKLVRGFLNVDIVWVKFARDETFSNVPEQIFDVNEDGVPDTADDEELYQVWPHDGFVWPETATGEERWASFIDEDEGFNLQDNDGLPPDYNRQMTVYFRPNCEITVPTGPPGGSYFGIISQIPVLVE
jgi:hypothetical protein